MAIPMDVMLDQVEWEALPLPESGEPEGLYATHQGVLRIGVFELDVAQLSNGQRVITEESMHRFMAAMAGEE